MRTAMTDSLKRNVFVLFCLITLAVIVYSNGVHPELLLDDRTYFSDQGNLSQISFAEILSKGFKDFVRPVPIVILKVIHSFVGYAPIVYYLYNLFLFITAAFLGYALLNRMTQNHALSFLATSLYVLHPINSFFINYKTAGNVSIFIITLELSILFFFWFIEKNKILYLILSLVFYSLSLLSHEIAFMIPIYLFITLLFYPKKIAAGVYAKLFLYFIPFLGYLFYRSSVIGKMISLDDLGVKGVGLLQYIATVFHLIGWYLSKLVFPREIIFIWDERFVGGVPLAFWIIPAAVVAVIVFMICRRSKLKSPELALGVCLFFVGFLPLFLASFTYSKRFQSAIIEPHWFGFSSLGFFLALAYSLISLRNKMNFKVYSTILFVILSLLGGITYQNNKLWKDEKTYCHFWLDSNAINGTPWVCLATDYIIDYDKKYFSGGMSCQATSFLAMAHHARGLAEEPLAIYKTVLQEFPSCPEAYYGLALLMDDIENYSQSVAFLNHARALDDRLYPLYKILVNIFHNTCQTDDMQMMKMHLQSIQYTFDD
jgi:hypothetical protein